jgi:hypothetical protein
VGQLHLGMQEHGCMEWLLLGGCVCCTTLFSSKKCTMHPGKFARHRS